MLVISSLVHSRRLQDSTSKLNFHVANTGLAPSHIDDKSTEMGVLSAKD